MTMRVFGFLLVTCATSFAVAQNESPLPHGSVGVGTHATVSQFKDLQITVADHVLLHKTLAEGLETLRPRSVPNAHGESNLLSVVHGPSAHQRTMKMGG